MVRIIRDYFKKRKHCKELTQSYNALLEELEEFIPESFDDIPESLQYKLLKDMVDFYVQCKTIKFSRAMDISYNQDIYDTMYRDVQLKKSIFQQQVSNYILSYDKLRSSVGNIRGDYSYIRSGLKKLKNKSDALFRDHQVDYFYWTFKNLLLNLSTEVYKTSKIDPEKLAGLYSTAILLEDRCVLLKELVKETNEYYQLFKAFLYTNYEDSSKKWLGSIQEIREIFDGATDEQIKKLIGEELCVFVKSIADPGIDFHGITEKLRDINSKSPIAAFDYFTESNMGWYIKKLPHLYTKLMDEEEKFTKNLKGRHDYEAVAKLWNRASSKGFVNAIQFVLRLP